MLRRGLLLVVMFGACNVDDGELRGNAGSSAATDGGAGKGGESGAGGKTADAAAGQGGAASPEPNKVAIALTFAESTCVARTSWVLPDPQAPVTATGRGKLAVDGGDYFPRVRCLVGVGKDGSVDLMARIRLGHETPAFNLNVISDDPAVPWEGGIQLTDPSLGATDISSTESGPCLFTFIDFSPGTAWGKIECAATKKRDDSTECGAAMIYFAVEDCFISRAAYLAPP